jgi:hypothetical protein
MTKVLAVMESKDAKHRLELVKHKKNALILHYREGHMHPEVVGRTNYGYGKVTRKWGQHKLARFVEQQCGPFGVEFTMVGGENE